MDKPFRPVLAQWMTAPENHCFSMASVNRLWGQLMGRGFVEPLDDMHKDNHATHPELLALLANAGLSPEEAVRQLYLSAFARRPTEEESRELTAFLDEQPDRVQGYAAALWILLSQSEFPLNH